MIYGNRLCFLMYKTRETLFARGPAYVAWFYKVLAELCPNTRVTPYWSPSLKHVLRPELINVRTEYRFWRKRKQVKFTQCSPRSTWTDGPHLARPTAAITSVPWMLSSGDGDWCSWKSALQYPREALFPYKWIWGWGQGCWGVGDWGDGSSVKFWSQKLGTWARDSTVVWMGCLPWSWAFENLVGWVVLFG